MNKKQSGAAIVEFALVFIIFMTFFLGITDFARMLFTWSYANEAARYGARYAAICGDTINQAQVRAKMQNILPQISAINLAWEPSGCTAADCSAVTVTITGLNYQWISPIAGAAALSPIPLPTFSTALPREIMRQDPVAAPFAC
jgi:Flp pilus assembly protein TadG